MNRHAPKPPKFISLLMAQVVMPTILFFSIASIVIALLASRFYSHHLRQTQMLNYIEFEQISMEISRAWDQLVKNTTFDGADRSLFNWDENGIHHVQGSVKDIPSWNSLQIKRIPHDAFALEVLGKLYLAKVIVESGSDDDQQVPTKLPFTARVYLKPIDINDLIDSDKIPLSTSIVYLVSKESQLLFSSSSLIGHRSFRSRPIVQKFILNQVDASGHAFVDVNHEHGYGYFFAIPRTNFVMFAEVSTAGQDRTFAPVLKQAAATGLIGTMMLALISYLIHRRLYLHLREIADAIEKAGYPPQDTTFQDTNIAEIAFLKQACKLAEQRISVVYQRLDAKLLSSEMPDSPAAREDLHNEKNNSI